MMHMETSIFHSNTLYIEIIFYALHMKNLNWHQAKRTHMANLEKV